MPPLAVGTSPIKALGLAQGDLVALLLALRNRVLGDPVLVQGAAGDTIKVSAFAFMVDGASYTKVATDDIELTGLGLTDTAAGQFRKVRLEINAAGAVSAVQGPIAAAQVEAIFPRRSAAKATFGWLEVPASFVYGTTAAGTAAPTGGDPDLNLDVLPAA